MTEDIVPGEFKSQWTKHYTTFIYNSQLLFISAILIFKKHFQCILLCGDGFIEMLPTQWGVGVKTPVLPLQV